MRFLAFIAQVLSQPIFKVLAYVAAVGFIGRTLEAHGFMRVRDFEIIAILVMTVQNQLAIEKINRHIDE